MGREIKVVGRDSAEETPDPKEWRTLRQRARTTQVGTEQIEGHAGVLKNVSPRLNQLLTRKAGIQARIGTDENHGH